MTVCKTCKHASYCEIVAGGYSSQVKSCRDYRKGEQTNFDNITESIETLASWLDKHAEFCQEIPCDECYVYKECGHQGCDVDFCSNAKRWLMWLKQPHAIKE